MSNFNVEMKYFDELSESEKEWVGHDDGARYLVITHNDQVLSIHSDRMEPEDAVFYRDLGWIEDEIMSAYKLGLKDGE